MKKLLLLTNACICVLFSSCQNLHQSKTESLNEKKPIIKENTMATDTLKKVNQTPLSGTAGTDQGIKKDTAKKTVKANAIIHKTPDQEKIDSIKNAKLKSKK